MVSWGPSWVSLLPLPNTPLPTGHVCCVSKERGRDWLPSPLLVLGLSMMEAQELAIFPKWSPALPPKGNSHPPPLPDWDTSCQHQRWKRPGFNPWVGKIPWRRGRQPTPVFLPGESPWAEELSGLQFMGSQRVRHDWSDLAHTHTCTNLYVQRGLTLNTSCYSKRSQTQKTTCFMIPFILQGQEWANP